MIITIIYINYERSNTRSNMLITLNVPSLVALQKFTKVKQQIVEHNFLWL